VNGKDPKFFFVTSIQRVQNFALWRSYCVTKQMIAEKFGTSIAKTEGSKHLAKYPIKAKLSDAANEYWLFHGASAEILNILTTTGYDPRVASVDGMFGGGFYLAENSSKSNQYIPCPKCKKNAVFHGTGCLCEDQENIELAMLVYRAALGDCHIALKYDQTKYKGTSKSHPVRRPPTKPGSFETYDSILGESTENGGDTLKFREIVLYEGSQAYPEYLIKFKRMA